MSEKPPGANLPSNPPPGGGAPPPQGPPPVPEVPPPEGPPPHKNWFAHHKVLSILAAAVVLLIVLIVSLTSTSSNKPTQPAAPANTPIVTATTPSSTPPQTTAPTLTAPPLTSPPATAVYQAISSHDWAVLARDPNSHVFETYVVYGIVTQFDANTGPTEFRALVDGQAQTDSSYYQTNTILAGDQGTLNVLVEGDQFTANVIVLGAVTYTDQNGGSVTAPELQVVSIKVTS